MRKLERVHRRIDGLRIQARAQIERSERFRRDEQIAAALQERDIQEREGDPALVKRFFALPEESIPAVFDQAPLVDGKRYYRTWFHSDRWRIERARAEVRIRHGDREMMRVWCDLYEWRGVEL